MGSPWITFLWLWPVTDHEPHCLYVPINKIWRWTESTPWSGWWHSHMAGIYSDCSTREIIITTSLCQSFSFTRLFLNLFLVPSWGGGFCSTSWRTCPHSITDSSCSSVWSGLMSACARWMHFSVLLLALFILVSYSGWQCFKCILCIFFK